jgi:hypothetical protein
MLLLRLMGWYTRVIHGFAGCVCGFVSKGYANLRMAREILGKHRVLGEDGSNKGICHRVKVHSREGCATRGI